MSRSRSQGTEVTIVTGAFSAEWYACLLIIIIIVQEQREENMHCTAFV